MIFRIKNKLYIVSGLMEMKDSLKPLSTNGKGYLKIDADAYRFSFNGQEKDDEIAGVGNIMTAEFWEYDTRLGRRWNIDPLWYPWQSPYVTFNNNPIMFNDALGLEGEKPGDKRTTADGCNEVYNGEAWQDNPSYLKETTITAKTPNTSEQWKSFVKNVGNEGYQSLINQLYQKKLSQYNEPNQLNIGIYGQNSDGTVAVPDEIKNRLLQEANAEAMPLLKVIYAAEVSGEDPSSFEYFINPFARASFLSAKAETVSSKEEAIGLLEDVTLEVAFSWYAGFKLTKQSMDLLPYPRANGYGMNMYIDGNWMLGIHWHEFKIGGRKVGTKVNRLHFDFPQSGVKHSPWHQYDKWKRGAN